MISKEARTINKLIMTARSRLTERDLIMLNHNIAKELTERAFGVSK